MRLVIIVLCLIALLDTKAQTIYHIPGYGFNSSFQDDSTGIHLGNSQAILVIATKDNDTLIYKFCNEQAKLEIIPDQDNIYDVSYKNYKVERKDIEITYSTYALANALRINIGGTEYQLSLFDGACDNVIKGLDYKYFLANNDELLSICFTGDVGLCAKMCCNTPDLKIMAGSVLNFSITKK